MTTHSLQSLSRLCLRACLLFALALLSAALTRLHAQAAPTPPAPAPGGSEEVVEMPAFSVSGDAADPFNASETSSFSRTVGKTIDTPMTIDVITPAMQADINPNTMFDVTNYFAGVSPGRGSGASGGFGDRMTLRGFESFSVVVDNFALILYPIGTQFDFNFPTFYMDHSEVVMGPDAIISPNGTPGGTINTITKSPSFTPSVTVNAEVGNFDADQLSVDATGPLGDGKHMAYRVMAWYMDTPTYMPGTSSAEAVGTQFTYKFTDTAQVTVKYFGFQTRQGGTAAATLQDGEEITTPNSIGGAVLPNSLQPGFTYNGWNGVASWSYNLDRNNLVIGELTTALNEHINMRLASMVYYVTQHTVVGYPDPNIVETFNQQTGQVIGVAPVNLNALPEEGSIKLKAARQVEAQNDIAAHYKVGIADLQSVTGWAYMNGSVPVFIQVYDKNMPTANLSVPQGYYAPPEPGFSQYTTPGQNNPGNAWSMQAYSFLRASFLNDRLFATAGASRTWAGMNYYSIPYVDQDGIDTLSGAPGAITRATYSSTTNALAPSVQPWHDAYMAGILGKVLPNVSVYYNYSTNAAIGNSTPLWQSGVQNEFGVKSSFFNGRLSVALDHFEITQNNVSETNPLFPLGLTTIPFFYTDLTNHGEEVNITGGITENLSVVASFTDQKLRDYAQRRRRNIPDTMANLLVDYHFTTGILKNAGVFVGVVHQGDVAGETETGTTSLGVPELPGYYLPAFTVVNAGGHYDLNNCDFHLNVNNVLNQRFFWAAQSRNSASPYPGANVTLSMTVHVK